MPVYVANWLAMYSYSANKERVKTLKDKGGGYFYSNCSSGLIAI